MTLRDECFIEAVRLTDNGKITAAVKLYRRLAKSGNASAQSNLANLLDDYVKPKRPKEAVYWYKRAARAGHSGAAYNLAVHYKKLGKERWHRYWLHVAARLGDRDAS